MCICCGVSKEEFVVTKNAYRIVRCLNCDLVYVKDKLTIGEAKKFYSSDYFSRKSIDGIGYRDYLKDEAIHRLNSRDILGKIKKIKRFGNLLDVGCGFGFFLDEAKKIGWNTYGTDISEEAYKYARERLNLEVYDRVSLGHKFKNDFFDVISLLGTIEHFSDPSHELSEINRILKKDGIFLITTLNIEGFIKYFKLFHYKPPEHLFYFSKKTIRKLLAKTGFCVEKINIYYKYYSLWDLVRRLEQFFCGEFIFFSSLLDKINMSNLMVKIPTNEVLILARKDNPV